MTAHDDKWVCFLAFLLLSGCGDYEAFKAVCESKGGESFWLRSERPLCLKTDAMIEVKKGYR